MEDVDQISEEGNVSGEALEQPEGILQLIDVDKIGEEGNVLGEALEQPEGILQLIEKLENIVDQMIPG